VDLLVFDVISAYQIMEHPSITTGQFNCVPISLYFLVFKDFGLIEWNFAWNLNQYFRADQPHFGAIWKYLTLTGTIWDSQS
jgi:hypothetical protein